MTDPKLPAPKRKRQPDHSIHVKTQWIEASGRGHGIYVVPLTMIIAAMIVLNLAAIMWRW